MKRVAALLTDLRLYIPQTLVGLLFRLGQEDVSRDLRRLLITLRKAVNEQATVRRLPGVPLHSRKQEGLYGSRTPGRKFKIQVAGERFTVPADASISIEHECGEDEEELEFSSNGNHASHHPRTGDTSGPADSRRHLPVAVCFGWQSPPHERSPTPLICAAPLGLETDVLLFLAG